MDQTFDRGGLWGASLRQKGLKNLASIAKALIRAGDIKSEQRN